MLETKMNGIGKNLIIPMRLFFVNVASMKPPPSLSKMLHIYFTVALHETEAVLMQINK